jgi:hypothetical protein
MMMMQPGFNMNMAAMGRQTPHMPSVGAFGRTGFEAESDAPSTGGYGAYGAMRGLGGQVGVKTVADARAPVITRPPLDTTPPADAPVSQFFSHVSLLLGRLKPDVLSIFYCRRLLKG